MANAEPNIPLHVTFRRQEGLSRMYFQETHRAFSRRFFRRWWSRQEAQGSCRQPLPHTLSRKPEHDRFTDR